MTTHHKAVELLLDDADQCRRYSEQQVQPASVAIVAAINGLTAAVKAATMAQLLNAELQGAIATETQTVGTELRRIEERLGSQVIVRKDEF